MIKINMFHDQIHIFHDQIHFFHGKSPSFFENVSGCSSQDLASRDVVSRAMTLEIREGRGVGPNKDGGNARLSVCSVKIATVGRVLPWRNWDKWWVNHGKHTKNYRKPPFFMGKSTISMAIFNGYVSLPEGKSW